MSPKRLLIIGAALLVIINGSIFGTIFMVDWLAGPTPEELAALKEAEEQARIDAIYAKLPPLEPFKSKANYVKSMGEAIGICEAKLHSTVTEHKSWEVNMIESRYLRDQELSKIFMEYETPAKIDTPQKMFDVECEVSEETKLVVNWKATRL